MQIDFEFKNLYRYLKCFIICSGFFEPFPNNIEKIFSKEDIQTILFSDKYLKHEINKSNKINFIDFPILNVYGEDDLIIIKEKSKRIEKLFLNVDTLYHKGDHIVPSSFVDIEKYINFLKNQLIL